MFVQATVAHDPGPAPTLQCSSADGEGMVDRTSIPTHSAAASVFAMSPPGQRPGMFCSGKAPISQSRVSTKGVGR